MSHLSLIHNYDRWLLILIFNIKRAGVGVNVKCKQSIEYKYKYKKGTSLSIIKNIMILQS